MQSLVLWVASRTELPLSPRPLPSAAPLLSLPTVPPSFPSAEPTTTSVLEGQSVRLACECHGIPFPALSWQKDGKVLPLRA